MAGTNGSTVDALLNQNFIKLELDGGGITKVAVVILLTLLSVYVNCVMLYSLSTKIVFKESSRYILFAHMLLNDSVHLLLNALMFVLGVAFIKLAKAVCSLLIFLATATFRNTPFNLAVMSLERYVAIRFPLRHAELTTQKRTCIAIGLVWLFGSVNILSDIIIAAVLDPNYYYVQMFCSRDQIFMKPWQLDVFNGCNAFYFVSVILIIVFIYISIMITARSVSSNKDSAKKAQRTVLLHFIQLGLCTMSFLYGTLERAFYIMAGSNTSLFVNLRYVSFLLILIVSRALSPLIYGLRDDAVGPLFKYHFCHSSRRFQTAVNVE